MELLSHGSLTAEQPGKPCPRKPLISQQVSCLALRGDDEIYPNVTWLPVVCIKEGAQPLKWQTLVDHLERKPRLIVAWRSSKSRVIRAWRSLQKWQKLAICAVLAFTVAILLGKLSPPPPVPVSLSSGERSLMLQEEISATKKSAIDAYGNKKWTGAIKGFERGLGKAGERSNDPESLIFLSNALANQAVHDSNSLELVRTAVSVPIQTDSARAKEILRGVAMGAISINCGVENFIKIIEEQDKDTQNEASCKGSDGKLVELTIADDKRDPTTAASILHKLQEHTNTLALIGFDTSDLILQAKEAIEKEKITVVTPTATSVELSSAKLFGIIPLSSLGIQRPYSQFLYQAPIGDAAAAGILAEYAHRVGLSNIVVVYTRNPYSLSFRNEFRKWLDQQDKQAEDFYKKHMCDLESKDTAECIGKAVTDGAKALLLIPDEDNPNNLPNAIRLIDKDFTKTLKLLGSDSMYTNDIVRDHGKNASDRNLTVVVSWARHNPNSSQVPQNEEKCTTYDKCVQKLFGGALTNWASAISFDSQMAIFTSLQKVLTDLHYGTSTLNPQQIRQIRETLATELQEIKADGATGEKTVTFDRAHNRVWIQGKIGVLAQVKEVKYGGYEYQVLE